MKKHFYVSYIAAFVVILLALPCIGQKLDIEVTTKSYGGSHAPENAIGVWIQSTQSKHIRTLAIWGIDPSYMLKNWRIITGLADTGFFDTSTFDGFTAATRPDHSSPVEISWNCKDSSGNIVADGDYQFWVEMMEEDYWWGMSDPNEVYYGRVAHGTITIDDQAKVAHGDTSDTCFSNFKVTYDPTVDIIYLVQKPNHNTSLSYWYNPILRKLTVELNSKYDRSAVLHIVNLKGELINRVSLVSQSNKFIWDTRNRYGKQVPSGVYLFEVRSGETGKRISSASSLSLIQ